MLRAVNSVMQQLPCHAACARSIQKLTNRLIAVAAIVCLPTVLAQHSDLQLCAGLGTVEERLACFGSTGAPGTTIHSRRLCYAQGG